MDYHGEPITVPTEGEILRIKGVLILKRNATRDYLDFVALADHMGDEGIAAALESFDRLYRQDNGESPLQQLQVQLANPLPYDLEETALAEYKNLDRRWHDWPTVTDREPPMTDISKDSAIPGLDREDAYQQVAAIPPPAEQAAIVRFLDWANGRLERAIRAKRKVIALLNEQKQAFIRREVLPYTPDAWIKQDATRIGYEVSFTRHFYQPQPLRTLEEIGADILAIEKEAEGLLDGLLKGGKA